MLNCPECGTQARDSNPQCARCGSSMRPRVRQVAAQPEVPSRSASQLLALAEVLRTESPRLAVKLKWPLVVAVTVVLLAIAGQAYLKEKRARENALTVERAVPIITEEKSFVSPRTLWLPLETRIEPDVNWLATYQRTGGVSSAPLPTEREVTTTGPFKETYPVEEYHEAFPPAFILKEMGLADYADTKEEHYYIYRQPREFKTIRKALGGPGGVVSRTLDVNVYYKMWSHRLALRLTAEGEAESRNWKAEVGRVVVNLRWFPYDSENLFATSAPDKDGNIKRTCVSGWIVPLATREIVEVTLVRMIEADRAQVEFIWKWVPTRVGRAFVTNGDTFKSLPPVLKKFAGAPGISMVDQPNGYGEARLALVDGKWQITKVELNDPR